MKKEKGKVKGMIGKMNGRVGEKENSTEGDGQGLLN